MRGSVELSPLFAIALLMLSETLTIARLLVCRSASALSPGPKVGARCPSLAPHRTGVPEKAVQTGRVTALRILLHRTVLRVHGTFLVAIHGAAVVQEVAARAGRTAQIEVAVVVADARKVLRLILAALTRAGDVATMHGIMAVHVSTSALICRFNPFTLCAEEMKCCVRTREQRGADRSAHGPDGELRVTDPACALLLLAKQLTAAAVGFVVMP
ncbi:hypothetical protein LMG9964_05540 [Paraburkholderia phenoliruptrix]|uniref:Uncharacterized protein n=1 Tax=Paraburkholderia phenoliruptrix TaxID=252970 RepID=A0A6J5KD66_9BURK|nr:hypothetical protein LMG9964_05540 [Paraburkholderia phenoliruptrix]